jgi:two-component system response regulator YesN
MLKVFLVEDEIVVREGIRDSVPWGKTAYTLAGEAPDGEMALPMIQNIKPDIIITDVRMPFMDGLVLSRIVRKALPWIKIIILSGHDEFEYAREAISIGVEEYLLKPVSAQDIIRTLDKVALKISEEQEKLRHFENLRERLNASAAADLAMPQVKLEAFNSSVFSGIDGDLMFTKLKYAAKGDLDPILEEYAGMLGNSFEENPMLVYLMTGEIIMTVSRIVETLGGDLKKISPFDLSQNEVNEFTVSKEIFIKKLRTLLNAVVEWRDAHSGGRYQAVIMKAREYIDLNYTSGEISLHSTANFVGISPNHLSAVFAQETGENFIDYLTRIRIEKAKSLLKNTAMKSADIAYEIGFNDPHYFSYIFKKNTGLSPREYRNTIS